MSGSGIDPKSGEWAPEFDGQRAPFEKGNEASVKHGARSERRIAPLARNLKRQVLRQLKLRTSDLDPIALGYLEAYVRAAVKVRQYDAWLEHNPLVSEDGTSPGFMPTYTALLNSSRLTLAKLEAHLDARVDTSPLAVLIGEGRRIREAHSNGESDV